MIKIATALDCDDTLFPFYGPFLEFFNKRNGTSFTLQDLTHYSLGKSMKITEDKATEEVHNFYNSSELLKLKPNDKAVDACRMLVNIGEKPIVVTSRPEVAREVTKKQLDNHFYSVLSSVLFASNYSRSGEQSLKKIDLCRSQGINTLVEDAGHIARDCANAGIRVFLFNKPWNQYEMPSSVIRVNNWQEIIEKF